MILILRQPGSAFTVPLVHHLEGAGHHPIVVEPQQAARALGVTFGLATDHSSLELAIGARHVLESEIEAVYVGIHGFGIDLWPQMSQRDAEYAVAETTALWLALLSSLTCPVINPPGRNMIAGAMLLGSELYGVAREVGLKTPTVAVIETGKVAAELIAMGTAASYQDLGDPEASGPVLDRRALTAYPTYLNQVRIKEIPGRGSLSLVVVGGEFFGAVVTADGEQRHIDEGELRPLATGVERIQESLGLVMAEYTFGFDGRDWVIDHMRHAPSAVSLGVHGLGPVTAAARYLVGDT